MTYLLNIALRILYSRAFNTLYSEIPSKYCGIIITLYNGTSNVLYSRAFNVLYSEISIKDCQIITGLYNCTSKEIYISAFNLLYTEIFTKYCVIITILYNGTSNVLYIRAFNLLYSETSPKYYVYYVTGLEKLKNPNRSSIFSPQKRKLPNRFSVISVTVVCFHSVLFFSFKIQGASSLLAQRLTYQYCFNTCSININIGISIINSNFAPTVQTRHISSTFIFPISGSLSY